MTPVHAGDPPDGHGDAGHVHEHGELRYVAAGIAPTVYAARAEVVFEPPAPAAEVRRRVETFLRDLGESLAASGCVLVGHIKGVLETSDQGSLTFSMTSLCGDARLVEALGGDIGAAVLTINVIMFGVSEAAAEAAVLECWSANAAASTRWR